MEEEIEIHGNLPREAPGDSGSTRKAFSLLKGLPNNYRILDVGCGPGAAALDLAEVGDGHITAVDISQSFLDELQKRAAAKGVTQSITTTRQSMFEMDFPSQSFDIVWSEGAIYIMGFENGLRNWKRFLKENGYLVLTELSWLTTPSSEPKAFWDRHYLGMQTVEQNLAMLAQCGYETEAHFVLPESSWWNEYYGPWEEKLRLLKEKRANNPEAIQVINGGLEEIELYRKFHTEYGYVFY
ncbi:MAG: class I SAM-dependent methyltransferase, partial [Minisyncoccia bacterium]